MIASARPQERPASPKKESDDQEKQDALMVSLRKSGEKGLARIKSFTLPALDDQKSAIPLFLAEKDTFFFNELRRVALQKLAYETWPVMQKLRQIFLKKTRVTKKEDIKEIREQQKELVIAHVISQHEIQVTLDQKNRKLAREETRNKHRLANALLAEKLNAKLSILQPPLHSQHPSLSLKARRPSTASGASHTSTTSSGKDAETLLHKTRKDSNSVIRSKLRLSNVSAPGEQSSPSHNSQCSSRASYSSQRDCDIHTALGVIVEPAPPTPRFYAPERSYNVAENSFATEEQKSINASGEDRQNIIERYLSDTLIDDFNFENSLITSGVKDVIEQFFADLERTQPESIPFLHQAHQKDERYSLVKKALSDFIMTNKKETTHGMPSAVKRATIMLHELLTLKQDYNNATRLYPELLQQYQKARQDPAHMQFGSEEQKEAKIKEKECETLVGTATDALSHFDTKFEKICLENKNLLKKIYRLDPFVSPETVAHIQNLRNILKMVLPPKKLKPQQHRILTLFGKKSTAALSSSHSSGKEEKLASTKMGNVIVPVKHL